MAINELSSKALGSAPAWLRFVVLGFALAGSYYKFDNAITEHERRMDRIDRRLDYIDGRLGRLDDKAEGFAQTNAERSPMMREMERHLEDIESRIRALEMRKVPSKGPL